MGGRQMLDRTAQNLDEKFDEQDLCLVDLLILATFWENLPISPCIASFNEF